MFIDKKGDDKPENRRFKEEKHIIGKEIGKG